LTLRRLAEFFASRPLAATQALDNKESYAADDESADEAFVAMMLVVDLRAAPLTPAPFRSNNPYTPLGADRL